MNTPRLSRPASRFSLSSLFLALVVTSSFTCPAFAAVRTNSSAGSVEACPPHYPDTAHVFNGCFLSTYAYLTRFADEFPAEQGRPITVCMRNANGQVLPHTIALVSWQGTWWCRDEYFGVFSLDCDATGTPNVALLTPRAERFLDRHAKDALRDPNLERASEVPHRLTSAQRLAAVMTAAKLIPVPHTIYWVRSGRDEVPVVFFRPGNGQVAVYDPAHGTGVAECHSREDLKVTALVATSMGYRSETIHPDLTGATGTLVAAAGSTSVAASQ